MSFSFDFSFAYTEGKNPGNWTPPSVAAFSVVGSNSGNVHAGKYNYLSLDFELEQALKFRNIVLYITSSGTSDSIRTLADLFNFAVNGNRLWFDFYATKRDGSNEIYRIWLSDKYTRVAKPPTVVLGELLMVKFDFESPKLERGGPMPKPGQ